MKIVAIFRTHFDIPTTNNNSYVVMHGHSISLQSKEHAMFCIRLHPLVLPLSCIFWHFVAFVF